MGPFSKPWKDLTFADNFIFCKVMQDERLCRRMIEILLGIHAGRIEYLETEKPLDPLYRSRGVRFDVYVEDSGGRVFDVELQAGNYSDILMRTRYYLGASDIAATRRRTKFSNIKETYIIFICRDDPLGAGLPVYTRQTRFLETDAVPYDDKSHAVFYNCSAYGKVQDKELRSVLRFIYEFRAESGYTRELEASTAQAKALSAWEDEYMYFTDYLEDEKETAREEGRTEGIEEGRAAGIHDAKIEDARNLILNGVSAEIVAKSIGFPLEQVMEIQRGL